MRMPSYRSAVSILTMAFSVLSCDSQPNSKANPVIVVSDRSRDPGAQPTNQLSFELLSLDPATRRAAFQELATLEKQCELVTEAVLKGGFEGIDLWRVSCADSGDWLVTFLPNRSVSATSCRTSLAECQAAWKSVARGP